MSPRCGAETGSLGWARGGPRGVVSVGAVVEAYGRLGA